jgi:hypothetical protein
MRNALLGTGAACRRIKEARPTKTIGVLGLGLLAIGFALWGGVAQTEPYVLFQDDFNDGDANGWTVLSGNWFVDNYEYVEDWTEQWGAHVTTAGDPTWQDYVYEARVMVQQPKEGGLAFRVSPDDLSGYATVIRPEAGDALLMKYWNFLTGSHIWLMSTPFSSSLNTWYSVRVVVEGDAISVYVDDALILWATDSEFPTGKVGFYQAESVARYDDAIVTTAYEPTHTPTPGPGPVGGIVEDPQLEPAGAPSGGGSSVSYPLAIAGAAAGGTILLAAGGWYARRRRMR